MPKSFFLALIFIFSCHSPQEKAEHKIDSAPAVDSIYINSQKENSQEKYGVIRVIDTEDNTAKVREEIILTKNEIIDSLQDPKAYLYNKIADLYLVIFTNEKCDTIGLIDEGETNITSAHLSAMQMNNTGRKEIIIDIRSDWWLGLSHGGDLASLTYSQKQIWDVDQMKPLFDCYYDYAQHSDNSPDSCIFKFDMNVSEKGIELKNLSGKCRPAKSEGTYVWENNSFVLKKKSAK